MKHFVIRGRGGLAILAIFSALVLCACGKESRSGNTAESPTGSIIFTEPTGETDRKTISSTIIPSDVPTPTQAIEVSQHITWALPFYNAPDSAGRAEINRLLAEKGLDCAVDFVEMGTITDGEQEEWYRKNKEDNTVPDVLCSGTWGTQLDAYDFIKSHFLELTDFFSTEEGKELKSLYGEAALCGVTINGRTYSLPKIGNVQTLNLGIYVRVPAEYRDEFAEFDGTYRSLREIRERINLPESEIVFESLDRTIVYGLLGYSRLLGVPYDTEQKRIVDPATDPDFGKCWSELLEDGKKGFYQVGDTTADTSKTVLATVYIGTRDVPQGYVELCAVADAYDPKLTMTYGVSECSEQKELALRVLYECFRDPEILSLLYPRAGSPETVREYLERMRNENPGDASGFLPELTEEQKSRFREYVNDLAAVFPKHMVENDDRWAFSEEFDVTEEFEELSRQHPVSDIIEEINRQFEDFRKKSGG